MRYCGFSEYFHDAGLAFVNEDGSIPYASHAERYTRHKFDNRIPHEMLRMIKDDDHVTFYEDHSIRRNRVKDMAFDALAHNHQLVMLDALDYDEFVEHHVSHAAAGFLTRPWESSEDTVTLTVDGVGEWQTMGIYDHNFKLLKKWEHPTSLGLFYTQVTKLSGLRTLEDEYVTMGMAAYGDDVCSQAIWEHFWELKNRGVNDRAWYKEFFEHMFKKHRKWDMATSVQVFAERIFMHLAKECADMGYKKLVVSGGCAQNIIAMTKIKESGLFEDMHVAVAPTDAGSALGAAGATYYKKTGNDRLKWTDAFLGHDMGCTINPKEVVAHLLKEDHCGIASGRAEYGPRALGNRSLIADPRKDIKDTVNKIKRRQAYRPFAPSILEEFADEYFEGPMNEYMQYQAVAKHDYKSVTHVDGTARVQIVKKDSTSIFRKIIEEYYEQTGVPMLLNTSLNIRGKPMVNTHEDAKEFENTYGTKVFV